jgi:hypothetical protein
MKINPLFTSYVIGIQSIIILFLSLTLIKCCSSNTADVKDTVNIDGSSWDVIKRKVDTIEVEKIKIVTKPGKDIHHTVVIERVDTIYNVVDTQAIMKDYYSTYTYVDTISLPDSIGNVSLTHTIRKNRIVNRTFKSNVKKKIINDVIYVKEPPKNKLYMGVGIHSNNNRFINGFNGGIIFNTKKDKLYKFEIGVTNILSTPSEYLPYIGASFYLKI